MIQLYLKILYFNEIHNNVNIFKSALTMKSKLKIE